jgi:LmbE family N-acetylglucosaminyl deacetylase
MRPAGVVLGVWAHPDDESYLSAALMRRVTAAGGRVHLVCATRGELGAPAPVADPAELGLRRERELRSAMSALGVHDVWFLGCSDDACAVANPDPIVDRLASAIRSIRPDVVVTFGPDGITGHPDHVAVSRWVTRAWRSVALEGCRLLYATMTDEFVTRHQRDLPELPLTVVGEPISIPDVEVALRIEPDPSELAAKRAALLAHRSQTGPLAELLGKERFLAWWTTETFREPNLDELAGAPHASSAARAG